MSGDASITTCQNCGETLETGWDTCPACLTPTSSGSFNCPNCQSPIKSNWKVCPECDTPLSGIDTPPAHKHSSISRSSSKKQIYHSIEQKKPGEGIGFDLEIPIAPGDMLGGRYRIVKKLGKGGFGSVYHVDDTNLNRQVALKIVVTGEGKASRATEQLIHEFGLREKINNTSHIIKAQDPRTCEYKGLSLVLLPMELADGESMRKWLQQNQDTDKRLKVGLAFFKQTCLGIKAIHDAGLVHLDIKPENIMLVGGQAKITDFGIGRYGASQFTNNPDQLLRQGIGTPQYMSPEQFHVARQIDIGPASDIYSLGIVLFELLDGNLPFDGTPVELREKHLKTKPNRTPKLEKWWPIVNKCLTKQAEDRYLKIDLLIADLDRVEQGVVLSVDVSCPNCEHINTNPEAKICDKCQTRLDSRFRPCPICDRAVRRDVKTCKGCGKAVAAYYLLLDRKKQIEELRDEDPVETIELLETVLREGADDYQEEAIKLIKDLRQKQSQVGSLIEKATKAAASAMPEQALEAWREVLNIFPRHRVAVEEIQRLEGRMGSLNKQWQEAADFMDVAEFGKAEQLLLTCLETNPNHKDTIDTLKSCRLWAKEYAAAFVQAQIFLKKKLFCQAENHIKKALSQAPKSLQALSLSKKINAVLGKTRTLMEEGLSAIRAARFDDADTKLSEAENLCQEMEELKEARELLIKTQKEYNENISNASQFKKDKNLEKALKSITSAVAACPDSKEASELLVDIEKNQNCAKLCLTRAETYSKAAQFVEAEDQIKEARKVWPKLENIEKTEAKISATAKKYKTEMSAAKKALRRKRFSDALATCKKAFEQCPQSAETESLVGKINSKQEDRKKHRKKVAKRIKWMIILTVVAGTLLFAVAWTNQQKLKAAQRSLEYGQPDMARRTLSTYIWLGIPDTRKDELEKKVDTAEIKSLIVIADQKIEKRAYKSAIRELEYAKKIAREADEFESRMQILSDIERAEYSKQIIAAKRTHEKLLKTADKGRLDTYGGETWQAAVTALKDATSVGSNLEQAIISYKLATIQLSMAITNSEEKYLAEQEEKQLRAARAGLAQASKLVKVAWLEYSLQVGGNPRKESVNIVIWQNGKATGYPVFKKAWEGSRKILNPFQVKWSPDGRYSAICYRDERGEPFSVLFDTNSNSVRNIGKGYRVQWITSDFLLLYREKQFFYKGSQLPFTRNGAAITGHHITTTLNQYTGYWTMTNYLQHPWYKKEPFECSQHESLLISPSGKLAMKLCSIRNDKQLGVTDCIKPDSYIEWFQTDVLETRVHGKNPEVLAIKIVDSDINFRKLENICSGIVYPCEMRSGFSYSDRFIALPIYETKAKSAANGGKYGDYIKKLETIQIWERKKDDWKELQKLDVNILSGSPTSIETILWNRGENSLLIGSTQYKSQQQILQHINMVNLKEKKIECTVKGREPQWIDGNSLFVYRVSGDVISHIKEIRIHDILSNTDISLLEIGESSQLIDVWVPSKE